MVTMFTFQTLTTFRPILQLAPFEGVVAKVSEQRRFVN